MKTWKCCHICYLKGKYCENRDRELPCQNAIDEEKQEQQKHKAISLIKDGRFVEALRLLEDD